MNDGAVRGLHWCIGNVQTMPSDFFPENVTAAAIPALATLGLFWLGGGTIHRLPLRGS